jgi:putative glutamine amidotransferase
MKPIIGINVDVTDGPPQEAQVQSTYFTAILKAGGIPILIPPMPDDDLNTILRSINGLMLIGGNDYNPAHYKEAACEKVKLTAATRDDFDMRLVQRAVVGSNLPLLGICAGLQALNIGLGGSLIQDIPSELPDSKVQHASPRGWEVGFNKHAVKISPDTKLASIYQKEEVDVPTSHHQSIRRLGAGLKPAAYAHDKIIEAVEYEGKPFVIGVQWHPERDFDGNKKLFEEFVKHAAAVSAAPAAR